MESLSVGLYTLLCSPSYDFPVTHAQLVRRLLPEHLLKASQRHIENQHLTQNERKKKRRFYTGVQKRETAHLSMFYTRRETKGKRSVRRFFPHAEKRETVDPPSFYTRPKTGNGESTNFFHAPNNGKPSICRNYTRLQNGKLSIRRFFTRRKSGNCQSADFLRVQTQEAINPPCQSVGITCVEKRETVNPPTLSGDRRRWKMPTTVSK